MSRGDKKRPQRTAVLSGEQSSALEGLREMARRRQSASRRLNDHRADVRTLERCGAALFGRKATHWDLDSLSAEAASENGLTMLGTRANVERIRDALAAAGLPRLSTLNGGEIRGLLPLNLQGSVGFACWDHGDHLAFSIVLSGKNAGLHYRSWTEAQGEDDTVELSEPESPEELEPRIRRVFEDLGYPVREVRYSGAQLLWDDDVTFTVTTDVANVS